MRKVFVVAGIVLIATAVIPAVTTYRTQISQYCGQSVPSSYKAEHTARWLGEWWPYREPRPVILCIGPQEHMNYRPLDIAGVMALMGAASIVLGRRHKHGKA